MKATQKTIRFFALMLALLLSASTCLAESIFPQLEEETVPAAVLIAPSYGAMANVAEDRVEQSAVGGTIVTYFNVSAAGYNRFGAYLGGKAYAVTNQDQQEGRIAYAVSNGQVSFVMIYSQAEHTMQLIYPQGTAYEKSAFPGYIRAEAGQEISIDGLGTFVFTELVREGNGYLCGFACKYNYDTTVELYDEKGNSYWSWNLRRARSWLQFSYYNTAATARTFSQMGNDLFDAELVYQLPEQVYTFPMKDIGRYLLQGTKCYISTAPDRHADKYTFLHNPPCNPLDRLNGAVVFDLSEGVRSAADGVLAVKLDFKTGDKYVVILQDR